MNEKTIKEIREEIMQKKREEYEKSEAISLEKSVEKKPEKVQKIRAVIKIYEENAKLYEIYKTYTGKKDPEILTKIVNDALKGKNVRKEIYEMIKRMKKEIEQIEEKMRKEFV
jgi:hypothetical protein